mmetsp:Transcript_27432/g.88161  ORF Transcript_27432/g.88161 Transcript_27432/m.88161 type:complete len:259 (-) Transcript_27432:556-1332(-)
MHSVTFSPVISRCTPPSREPTFSCASKVTRSSLSTASSDRVLSPDSVTCVLPCIGSQHHTTGSPACLTASTSGGSSSSHRSAPRRVMSTTLPGCAAGSGHSVRMSATSSAGSELGPTLMPIGFCTPRKYSTCAWSSCRVRSPIHSMCALVLYHLAGRRLPLVAASSASSPTLAYRPVNGRVMASSYGRCSPSWLQKKRTLRKAGSSMAPHTRVKSSESRMRSVISSNSRLCAAFFTKPKSQSSARRMSAKSDVSSDRT